MRGDRGVKTLDDLKDALGRDFHLTGRELELMMIVIENNGYATKQHILDQLYSVDQPELKIIDVFLKKINKKLSTAGKEEHIIKDHGEFAVYSGNIKAFKANKVDKDYDALFGKDGSDVVHWTGKEKMMVEILLDSDGDGVSKEEILDHLYSIDQPELKIVDVFAMKINRKLRDKRPEYQIQRSQIGYKITKA